VSLKASDSEAGCVRSGSIECLSCGQAYPVIDGIAILAAIDQGWRPVVKEMLSRIEMSEKVFVDGGLESDKVSKVEAYQEASMGVMVDLFEEATEEIEILPGSRILDIGAGGCGTSHRFSLGGADVVSIDPEFNHLRMGEEGSAGSASDTSGTGFSRMVADAHRIPFEDSTFDVTFCRSTIHHLDRMPSALREMARVTRPGGHIYLVSEPVRGILDKEIDYLGEVLDYQEGLNERTVPIYYYTVPLRRYCRKVRVSYFRPGFMESTRRVLAKLRITPEDHFHDGESLSFIRSMKLLFCGCGVNVEGRRGGGRIAKPGKLPPEKLVCEIDDVFTGPVPLEFAAVITNAWMADPKGVESGRADEFEAYLRSQKRVLRAAHRRFLDPAELPDSIEMGSEGQGVLRKGWRGPEDDGRGLHFRHTERRAVCSMRNVAGTKSIGVRIFANPAEFGPSTGTISVNEHECIAFDLKGSETVLLFEKPPTIEPILEVEIRNDRTYVPDEVLGNGDLRELGVSVSAVWQE